MHIKLYFEKTYEARQKTQKVTFLDFQKNVNVLKKRNVITRSYKPKVLGLKTTLNQICCPRLRNY